MATGNRIKDVRQEAEVHLEGSADPFGLGERQGGVSQCVQVPELRRVACGAPVQKGQGGHGFREASK